MYSTKWPPIILDFQGIKDYQPFESHRKKLKSPTKDPFELIFVTTNVREFQRVAGLAIEDWCKT
jgi:hypothetical protein